MNAQAKFCGTILLADDGSEFARAAVEFVGQLPLAADCRVQVLRVFSSQQATELSSLEDALNHTCEYFRQRGFQVASDLVLGAPAQVIAEYAERYQVDLIAMGAKGLRATLGILLGGVAQQVVEYAARPVLIARPGHLPLRRVLALIDGSPSSAAVLDYFVRFPFSPELDVRVMHVLPPPPLPVMAVTASAERIVYEPLAVTEAVAEQRAREEQAGHALLQQAVDLLAGHGFSAQPVLKRGDAATEILDYVKAEQIDLIISGSRGLSEVRAWLLGSVSRKLVHYAPCSVLIVRSPSPTQ